MPTRGPVVRALIWVGLTCGAFLALASSVVLHGYPLVVVGVVAALVGCAVYGAGDGGRAVAIERACKAAASTVGVILVVTGVVVLAGGTVAALVSGLALVVVGAVWLRRAWWGRHAGAKAPGPALRSAGGGPASVLPAPWLGDQALPVAVLPTAVLGSHWLRTTATLACRLEPAARQSIILRRQETLDELERRDPVGFARWLAAGPGADSDPASFVRSGRTTDSDAA